MNIKSIFLNTNLKIDESALDKYLSYIKENALPEAIKSKTAYHHILPRAKKLPFRKYANLKLHKWNGVHLYHKEHYIAHHLLSIALEHISTLSAFCAMNNTDIKNGRLQEIDLVSADEYDRLMQLRSIKQRELMNSKEWKERSSVYMKELKNSKEWKETKGKEATRKRKETISTKEWKESTGKMVIENYTNLVNSKEWKETKGKEKSRKLKEIKNSKEWKETVGKPLFARMSELKNSKEWKETKGKERLRKWYDVINSKEWKETKGKEAIRKQMETKSTKEWKETKGDPGIKKMSNTKLKGFRYDIIRDGEVIYKEKSKPQVNIISNALIRSSIDKPLGHTIHSKIRLNSLKKLHMIGMYVIKYNINEN